jgi:hypothetical protein
MMLINTRRDFLKIGLRTFGSIGAASVVGKLSQVNALAQSGWCAFSCSAAWT